MTSHPFPTPPIPANPIHQTEPPDPTRRNTSSAKVPPRYPSSFAQEELSFVPVNNVLAKIERNVRLRPRPLQLLQPSECKDVVADNVILSKMLVKTAALGPINKIVLDQYPAASLVGIKPPATMSRTLNIMGHIETHSRPWRYPQRINRSHVAETPWPR